VGWGGGPVKASSKRVNALTRQGFSDFTTVNDLPYTPLEFPGFIGCSKVLRY
jgi:hypothetical protein